MTGQAIVIQGDARRLPLPDESVDLIVTSPPYFALRSYRDDGEHYTGQIGSEPTPQEFLEALWECTAEMARVLKPSGSIFVNLGDKYAGSGGHNNSNLSSSTLTGGRHKGAAETGETRSGSRRFMGGGGADRRAEQREATRRNAPDAYNKATVGGARAKSLMLLPHRYAIGCEDLLGLIVRQDQVWSKPNGLPESVTDRTRRSHEYWFHLVKSPRYFAAVDEIRELQQSKGERHEGASGWNREGVDVPDYIARGFKTRALDPLGKLPESVWSIPSEPLVVPQWARDKYDLPEHFAAFPQEWPRRLILGWSPSGICVECGEGRRPVVDKSVLKKQENYRKRPAKGGELSHGKGASAAGYIIGREEATIIGYACACTPRAHTRYESDPETGEVLEADPESLTHLFDENPAMRPAVVLDPFGGTGTTALVARALGRIGISVDLSHDYCELARWRIFESGHGKKAMARTNAERQGTIL